ncbi:MAG: nitrogen regulation protein NR(II) [Pseudomonadota bacterium]
MQHNDILDALNTAIVMIDEQFSIRYVNAAAESLLDHSARRLINEPLASSYVSTNLPTHSFASCLSDEQTVINAEAEFVLHSGQKVTAEVSVQCLKSHLSENHQKLLLLELRQVDIQRQISQENSQLQQLHATQNLLRGMAHEIKNPLGGLRGAAQLLARQLKEPGLKEYTDLIIAQSDRLRGLIDRLLGPAKLEQPDAVNLHQLLERVAQTVAYEYNEGLIIKRDYDPSLPDLRGIGDLLEQVFLNITQNAAQALEGKGQITLKTRVEHQLTLYGNRYRQCAVISIIDNGPGISDSLRPQIFYPMVSGRSNGTGLGLSLAHSLVHQHGGKIEFESEPGHTCFRVYLPYRVQEDVLNDSVS